MTHTPTPWKIDGGKGRDGDLYIWMTGNHFGDHAIATVHEEIEEGAAANAAYIVAACNAHADLLAALEDAADALSAAQGEWASVSETYAPESTQALKQAEAKARAAIAGAKG